VLDVMQQSGPAGTGLTFIWMPQLFAEMPLGNVLAILFFLGLAFAAFSSLISMIELATRICTDLGIQRSTAVSIVGGAGFLFGLPSALNLNVLANQDFVWGIGLLLSGAFVAFAVIRYGVTQFRMDAILSAEGDRNPGRSWDFQAGVLVPLQAVCLLGWWLYRSATVYAPDTWFNPLEPFSIMTCLLQWGLVLVILLAINQWLCRRSLSHPPLDAP
jgi:NSS family neurotransmitter:Na+ symporter